MKRMRAGLIAIMVAAMAGTGCEQIDNAPMSADMSVQASTDTDDRLKWGLAKAQFAQQGAYVSQMIGREGGWLNIGNHYLQIMPGAVDGPTRFVMQQRAGDNFILDLHAYRPNGRPVLAFPARSVYLYMTYEAAVAVEGMRYGIGYLPAEHAEGGIVPLVVFHYPQYFAVGTNLTHFSTYALIVD